MAVIATFNLVKAPVGWETFPFELINIEFAFGVLAAEIVAQGYGRWIGWASIPALLAFGMLGADEHVRVLFGLAVALP